jgi:hypothetical protein
MREVGPLISLRRGGNRPPLLGGAPFGRGKNTIRGLRGVLPLFVGIAAANITKKFHIREIVARAANQLNALFQKHLGSADGQ